MQVFTAFSLPRKLFLIGKENVTMLKLVQHFIVMLIPQSFITLSSFAQCGAYVHVWSISSISSRHFCVCVLCLHAVRLSDSSCTQHENFLSVCTVRFLSVYFAYSVAITTCRCTNDILHSLYVHRLKPIHNTTQGLALS